MHAAVLIALLLSVASADAQQVRWASAVTGGEITGTVHVPKTTAAAASPAVVYLKNLSIPRLGQKSDDSIVPDRSRARSTPGKGLTSRSS